MLVEITWFPEQIMPISRFSRRSLLLHTVRCRALALNFIQIWPTGLVTASRSQATVRKWSSQTASSCYLVKTPKKASLICEGSIALYCTVLHSTALYRTVLHCTALHRTVLHCTALYCTVPHCVALYCTVPHCVALYCTLLHCTALYCTLLHFTALCCTLLHCTALYCTLLHCTALYCTVPHCVALYCTVLHSTALCWTLLLCTALHCTVLHAQLSNTRGRQKQKHRRHVDQDGSVGIETSYRLEGPGIDSQCGSDSYPFRLALGPQAASCTTGAGYDFRK